MRRFEIFALVAISLCACRKQGSDESPALRVEVRKVARGTVADVLETSGMLEPLPGMDVKLGALVSGRLAEVKVAEGDSVRQGQLLARVEATALRDALTGAQAQLAAAEAQQRTSALKLERADQLFDAGIAARQEVDDARAQAAGSEAALKGARAGLSAAENQFSRTELNAPFEGQVAHVFAAAGEPVEGNGKPLVEVVQTAQLEVHAPLSPPEAVRVRVGQHAEVSVDGSGKTQTGEVVAVSPVVDPETGTLTVRARMDNRATQWVAGAAARLRLFAEVRQNVLVVPREALLFAEDKKQPSANVMVLGEDGKAHRREIRIGALDPQQAEVLEGLSEGERVIVQGAYALPDGTAVQASDAGAAGTP